MPLSDLMQHPIPRLRLARVGGFPLDNTSGQGRRHLAFTVFGLHPVERARANPMLTVGFQVKRVKRWRVIA